LARHPSVDLVINITTSSSKTLSIGSGSCHRAKLFQATCGFTL
jgi:hypothetical protein